MGVRPVDTESSMKTPNSSDISLDSVRSPLHDRETYWRSIYISVGILFIAGTQGSAYYMSMWPYLSGVDKSADLGFLGWVVAACSLGISVTNPLFGLWNQKTMSCRHPVIFGLCLSALGQIMYGAISGVSSYGKWYILAARLLTGLGAGNSSAIKAYIATASVPKDRIKAISYGSAGAVLGVSFGPIISAAFTPLGESGFYIGPVNFNMYTTAAYVMALLCISGAVVMFLFFKEDYAGIVNKKNEKEESKVVIPKYDLIPALICMYLSCINSMIAVNIEVMSTPLTTVLYDWKDSQSILYNGIMESITCIVSVFVNLIIGKTSIGKVDKRLQLLFGISLFFAFHLVNYPWWFYSGPLHYLPPGSNTTVIGGCLDSYQWCSSTTRIPMFMYIFSFIVFFGVAFPFVHVPAAALFSEILGPRIQGTMQGLYSFGGSATMLMSSLVISSLFQHIGFKYVILFQSAILILAFLLVTVFYKRMVPLKMEPRETPMAKL